MHKTKSMRNRVLSMALALILVLGLLPAAGLSALAAPENGVIETVAEWNYSSASPATAPATGGINKDGAILTNFKNVAPTFSTSSLCITDWTGSGDRYWMIAFSSKDFEEMAISLSQRSSGTGPRNFKLQYSSDGVSWADVTENVYDTDITSTTLGQTLYSVPLPAAINGLDTAYLRLLLASEISSRAGSGTYSPIEEIASTGTSNINYIVISGTYTGDSDEPTDPPDPAVITIAEARALGSGASVVVEGVLTRAINSSGPVTNNCTLYIQDDTAGLAVYASYAYTHDSYPIGSLLRVSGTLSTYTGILEIGGSGVTVDIEVLSDQLFPRAPETITIAQLRSLAYEGKLVRIEGVALSSIATNSNHTIRDIDTGATVTMRCTDGTTLPASDFSVNDMITVVGIAANYNGDPQLMVSKVEDISEYKEPEEDVYVTEKVVGWEYTSVSRPTHFTNGTAIPTSGNGAIGAIAANTGEGKINAELTSNRPILWYTSNPISIEASSFGPNSYWEFTFSTKEYINLTLTSMALRTPNSSMGPRVFKLYYSLDGVNYSPVSDNASDVSFTTGGTDLPNRIDAPIVFPAETANQDTLYVRAVGLTGNGGGTGWLNIGAVIFEGDRNLGPQTKVDRVTANPANNSKIALGSTVTLNCATAGATIYYAMNDSAPQVYAAPIAMNTLPATIKAYSERDGLVRSDEVTFAYEQAKVANVTARPGNAGKIALGSFVTLLCETDGATIMYSINGGAEQVYTTPVAVYALPATISAYATRAGFLNSDVVTFGYTEKQEGTGVYNHYYGDLHNHTGYSDGASGSTPATAWAAGESRGLDFFAVTDHSNNLDSTSALGNMDTGGGNGRWANTITQKNAANKDGQYVAVSGNEFTWSSNVYGHINTLFYDDGFISRNNSAYTSTTNGAGLQAWYDKMAQYPTAVNMFNHPGNTFGRFGTQAGGYPNITGNFMYWTEARDEVMHLMEIGNGAYRGPTSSFGNNNASGGSGYWRQWPEYSIALEKGWHIAPANNADEHGTGWANYRNCTVIMAEELTFEALRDACLDRRVYSTENKGITVDYTINGEIMGSRIQTPVGTILEITVDIDASGAVDKRNIGIVELITNGNVRVSGTTITTNPKNYIEISEQTGTATFTVTATEEETFYYIRVRQNPQGANKVGNNEAYGTASQQEIWTVTAPIWIESFAAEAPAFDAETLTLTPGSTSRDMNFTWYSDRADNTASVVQIAKKSDMAGGEFPATDIITTTNGTVGNAATGKSWHKAGVTRLDPGVEYVYRVSNDGTLFSKIYEFRTGPEGDFSFVAIGDSQLTTGNQDSLSYWPNPETSTKNGWADTVKRFTEEFPEAAFILSAGDQVDASGGNETEYANLFAPEELRSIPLAPAMGNHDRHNNFDWHYNLPNAIPNGAGATLSGVDASGNYWFRFNDALFVVLNNSASPTAASVSPYIAQFDATLKTATEANPDAKWIIVNFHKSVAAPASHQTDADVRVWTRPIMELMDKYEVDVVFAGHDHVYSRSWFIKDSAKVEGIDYAASSVVNPEGTLYISLNTSSGLKYYDYPLTGSGNPAWTNDTSNMFYQNRNTDARAITGKPWYTNLAYQGYVPNFSVVDVTADSLTVRTYRTDTMAVIDEYTINKADVQEPQEVTVNILHTNDSHGRLYQVDGNNSGMIGIDKIAALKNNTENAILVDAGDAIHGLPIVNVNNGLNAIELMAAAGYDVMTPGNHDFNYGSARLSELASIAAGNSLDIISSNSFVTATSQSFLPTTKIVEIDGVKVGFFGLTTQTTPVVTNPVNVDSLEFRAYKQSAESAIAELKAAGADIIVAIAHISRVDIVELVKALDVKPDAVIEGHDHILGSITVDGVLIAGAGQYQENLGMVSITIKDGVVIEKTASIIAKADTADIEGDASVKAKAEVMKQSVLDLYSEVVAKSEVLLSSARGDVSTLGVRNSEQALGNIVADAMKTIGGADIAVTNGGGLRADVKVGDITRGDINSVLPFGNVLVIKEATPKALKEIMENGLQFAPGVDGRFPQISGMSVVYDQSGPVGGKVMSISISGKALDLNDDMTIYKLATNDFMANGGDGYTAIAELATIAEIGSLDTIFEQYITSLPNKTITADVAKIEGRIKVFDGKPTLESLTAATSSTNLQNSTTVTITVTGHYSDGSSVKLASASVKLKQNGTQTVKVGEYNVTVVVNGNNKITDCYVGVPAGSGGQNGNNQGGNSQGGNGKGNQQ